MKEQGKGESEECVHGDAKGHDEVEDGEGEGHPDWSGQVRALPPG